jgi:hypothetical protein
MLLWISLCLSWSGTRLDTRFVRRDVHLLTTVGNIRWEGEMMYQGVSQIRDKTLRHITGSRAVMWSNHESNRKISLGCAQRLEVISNPEMLNVKLQALLRNSLTAEIKTHFGVACLIKKCQGITSVNSTHIPWDFLHRWTRVLGLRLALSFPCVDPNTYLLHGAESFLRS